VPGKFLRGQSVQVPQISGLDLAREAQALRPGIRLLLMSGYTETSVSAQGLISPATVFIHKPFTAAALR
jgi:two-component system, cell cycle sensor histidine kinase and response regulator CckA